MNRYILFAGDIYYPRGGARDLVGYRDSVEECKQLFYIARDSELGLDLFNDPDYTESHWAHVYDTESSSIVLTLSQDVWEELNKR